MPRWRSDSTLNVIKNFNHSKLKYKFPNGDSRSCGFHAARLLLFFSAAAASASGTACEGSPPHPRGCGRTRHFGSPVAHRKRLCASTPFISEMLAKLKELQSHGGPHFSSEEIVSTGKTAAC